MKKFSLNQNYVHTYVHPYGTPCINKLFHQKHFTFFSECAVCSDPNLKGKRLYDGALLCQVCRFFYDRHKDGRQAIVEKGHSTGPKMTCEMDISKRDGKRPCALCRSVKIT